jgi:hypothetical protein
MIVPAADELVASLPPIDIVALLGGYKWHIDLVSWPEHALRLEMTGGPEEFHACTLTIPRQVRSAPSCLRVALIPKEDDIGYCSSWIVYCDVGGTISTRFTLKNGWSSRHGGYALKNLVPDTAANPFSMIDYFDPLRGSGQVLGSVTIKLERH